MKRIARPLLAGGLALALAALAGCGGSAADAIPVLNAGKVDVNTVEVSDVKVGGELRWPYNRVPLTFNYYQLNGQDRENTSVIGALLPRIFLNTADGHRRPDPNFLLSADLVRRAPQTVRYVLNPRAVWSDGAPITWRDFETQWKALNGSNPAYQVLGTDGYADIASVARGDTDKQVVVTFKSGFAEWQGLFSPLYPAAQYNNPTAFNTAWVKKIPVTAGPFVMQALDPVSGILTLARNDAWWGPKAKLDRIVFKPYDRPKYFEGLATNDLDFAPVDFDINLARQARTLPGFTIRQSVNRQYQELLVNGGPGTALADLKLRQAIARGLDRTAIAKRAVGEINQAIRSTDNHLYPMGDSAYQDNSGELEFNAARANQLLDSLGWRRQGNQRVQNGKPLTLRVAFEAGDPVSEQVGAAVGEQLTALGVSVTSQPMTPEAKDLATRTGAFDLLLNRETLSAMPLSTELRRYYEVLGTDVGSNYGQIYNDDVVAAFHDSQDNLDELRRNADVNGLDKLIWSVVHSITLFPNPGGYATRTTLQNFGAPGLADIDYAQIGFDS